MIILCRFDICYKLMITGVRIEHTSSNSVNFKNNTKYSCQGTSSVWKSTDFEFFMHFYSTKAIIFLHYVVISYFLLKRLKYVGTVTESSRKEGEKKPTFILEKYHLICVFHFKNILGWGTHTKNVLREKMAHVFFGKRI